MHLAWRQDRAWLVLTGEVDRTTVHHVQDALREITVRPGRVVHLDLSRLIVADAAGARALDLAVRQLRDTGRQVRVADAAHVRR